MVAFNIVLWTFISFIHFYSLVIPLRSHDLSRLSAQVAMTMAAAEAAARPKKRRNPQPSQQSPREVVEVSPEELS